MRLFTALFNLAKLPVVVAKDVLLAVPESACGKDPFSDTRAQCAQIDIDLGVK